MFEEFYEMYEPEEQEVVALINRCIGGGFNWKGNFWEMTVVTPKDPPDERRTGKRSGGAPLVYLRDSQCP